MDKLTLTAEKLIIVSYSQMSKAYWLWNPQTDDIMERFDVTINKNRLYQPDDMEGSDIFSRITCLHIGTLVCWAPWWAICCVVSPYSCHTSI